MLFPFPALAVGYFQMRRKPVSEEAHKEYRQEAQLRSVGDHDAFLERSSGGIECHGSEP